MRLAGSKQRAAGSRPLAGAKRLALLAAMGDVAGVRVQPVLDALGIGDAFEVPADVCDCLIELLARLPIVVTPDLPAASRPLPAGDSA